jgi:hypothetical protein
LGSAGILHSDKKRVLNFPLIFLKLTLSIPFFVVLFHFTKLMQIFVISNRSILRSFP